LQPATTETTKAKQSAGFRGSAGLHWNVAVKKNVNLDASLPPGLVFLPEFLTSVEERDILAVIGTMEFRDLLMHGVRAKRRIKQFGLHYAFETYRLAPTDPIPSAFATI
jgi:hypothetical protein